MNYYCGLLYLLWLGDLLHLHTLPGTDYISTLYLALTTSPRFTWHRLHLHTLPGTDYLSTLYLAPTTSPHFTWHRLPLHTLPGTDYTSTLYLAPTTFPHFTWHRLPLHALPGTNYISTLYLAPTTSPECRDRFHLRVDPRPGEAVIADLCADPLSHYVTVHLRRHQQVPSPTTTTSRHCYLKLIFVL